MPDGAGIRVHPAASAFPLLPDDELQQLAEDIRANGLFSPIMLDVTGEWLVDGRNRLRACELAKIEPRFDRLPKGVDPRAFIVSMNLSRRDLSKGQRALALALVYPEAERGRGKIDPARKALDSGGFSHQRLRDARQIARHDDLTDLVRSGAMPFDLALTEARSRETVHRNGSHYMARLRAEAPDLASQVSEEHLSLIEAWGAFEARQHEAEIAERQTRDNYVRLTEGAWRGLLAYADPDFVDGLAARLRDSGFTKTLVEKLGPGTTEGLRNGSKNLEKILRAAIPLHPSRGGQK